MKRITLLPDVLVDSQRRKLARARYILLLVAVLLAALACIVTANRRLGELDEDVVRAEQRIAPQRRQREANRLLEIENARLASQLHSLQMLREPIPTAAVLALLSQLIPDDVTVHRLVIERLPAALASAVVESRDVTPRPVLLVRFDAVADTTKAVPIVVKRLIDSQVFTNVQVAGSSSATPTGGAGHLFQIRAEIPLHSWDGNAIAHGGQVP